MADPRSSAKMLGIFTAQERRIIRILRVMVLGDGERAEQDRQLLEALSPPAKAAFQSLAQEMARDRLILFAPQSRFASDDELAVLSRIILFQRPRRVAEWRLGNALQQAMKACADCLLAEGRRLPPRPALTDAYIHRDGRFRVEEESASSGNKAGSTPHDRDRSVKARVLDFLGGRDLATTSQFRALGVSRQYLSRLYKAGYVDKVGHGIYRKASSS